VSGQSFYNWERGQTRPRDQQIAKIAAFRAVGKREAGGGCGGQASAKSIAISTDTAGLVDAVDDVNGASLSYKACPGDANVGDPVALPACKTSLDIFAFEARRSSAKPRLVDILQRIDVDNCIELIRDFAGN
jgi:hypothetical protein